MDNKENKHIYKRQSRAQVRLFLQDYKASRPCSCGESRHYCLVFHHKDRTTKQFGLSQAGDKSFKDIIAEVAKCRVMCSNCHLELHFFDDTITRERIVTDTKDEEQLLLFE